MPGATPSETRAVGHYRLEKRLGEGGMGIVYLAYDTVLERQVALKLLGPQVADQNARALLLSEARAASGLKHPNICTIYEVGECAGEAYIAMEYVEGRPLSDFLSAGPLPYETVLRYGMQIADALAHAHEHGILHCDLKSSNVIVTAEGQAKLVDFGLSRRLCDGAGEQSIRELSESGVVQGTLAYLAPEVLRGAPADARTDVWGLGVLLYEITAGHVPFRGNTGFEIASSILRDPVPPLATRVPAGLRTSVMRCLEKRPETRYKQAGEVRAALEAAQSEAAGKRERRLRGPRRWWTYAAVLLALAALAGLYAFRKATHHPIDSVAVLPFINAVAETEYLSDGLTETLINNLSQLPNLKVMSRQSVYRYKGREVDARTVGQDLGVRAVLTGRMSQRGDTLYISMELVDARDNRELWGGRYERKLANVLALQDDISREVSENLRYWATGTKNGAVGKHYPANRVAYQLYLQGRYHWNRRSIAEIYKAVDYFNQAIAQDPNYGLAYAGLADCYLSLGWAPFGPLAPHQAMLQAKSAALRALEIDNTLAEAHTSLAYVHLVYDLDLPASDREFRRAIELNPNYAPAHQWRGLYLSAVGNVDRAIAEIKNAQELDPLNPVVYTALSQAYYFAGQYDTSIDHARKALELEPGFALAHFNIGRAYVQKKMYDEALAEFHRGDAAMQDNPGMVVAIGYTYGVSGRRAEAMKVLAQLQRMAKRQYVPALYTAAMYAAMGDNNNAFAWLEKTYEERSEYLVFLNVDPVMAMLRPDPRFDAFLQHIGVLQSVRK